MTSKLFSSLALVGTACLGLSLSARANDVPVSLLVYPTFDNVRGAITLVTVVNTNSDQTLNANNQVNGTVAVEFVYINYLNCQEFNRTRILTPNDTYTAETHTDNPNQVKGYVYIFAKSPTTGKAIKFDWLIGLEEVFDGQTADYFQVKPYGFKAGAALAAGAVTDLNANGIRNFDGLEYEAAPDELLSPRFLGQPAANGGTTDVVLINLTGGSQFHTIVDFLVYNDQEDVFSAQYDFNCWVRVPLLAINGVFGQTFLQSTNSNNESVGGIETGWYRMDGLLASSLIVSIADPAFLSMQIDRGVVGIGSAFLPYCVGTQDNGSLISHSVLGN
jgi:hypothetical protein